MLRARPPLTQLSSNGSVREADRATHCGSADDVRACSAVVAATRPQRVSAVGRRSLSHLAMPVAPRTPARGCVQHVDRSRCCRGSAPANGTGAAAPGKRRRARRRHRSDLAPSACLGGGPEGSGLRRSGANGCADGSVDPVGLLPAHRARTSRTRRASGPEARVARTLIEVRLRAQQPSGGVGLKLDGDRHHPSSGWSRTRPQARWWAEPRGRT
jgi:hypothetical protein